MSRRDLGTVLIRELGADGPEATVQSPGAIWRRLQATRSHLDEEEHSVIRRALIDAEGVVAHAARELGIAYDAGEPHRRFGDPGTAEKNL
jgi:transcriptional regulator with GAF, ATPase, and Fis domain